jgi:hypothetical protein
MVYEDNVPDLPSIVQLYASAHWAILIGPGMQFLFEVNPAVPRLGLPGLLEVTEMQRFTQIAGQFVESILLSIVGAQDVQ